MQAACRRPHRHSDAVLCRGRPVEPNVSNTCLGHDGAFEPNRSRRCSRVFVNEPGAAGTATARLRPCRQSRVRLVVEPKPGLRRPERHARANRHLHRHLWPVRHQQRKRLVRRLDDPRPSRRAGGPAGARTRPAFGTINGPRTRPPMKAMGQRPQHAAGHTYYDGTTRSAFTERWADQFPSRRQCLQIQLSMGAYNCLQQSDATPTGNSKPNNDELGHPTMNAFKGGIPGSLEGQAMSGECSTRAGVRSCRPSRTAR